MRASASLLLARIGATADERAAVAEAALRILAYEAWLMNAEGECEQFDAPNGNASITATNERRNVALCSAAIQTAFELRGGERAPGQKARQNARGAV